LLALLSLSQARVVDPVDEKMGFMGGNTMERFLTSMLATTAVVGAFASS
jgi:hypothetical protein